MIWASVVPKLDRCPERLHLLLLMRLGRSRHSPSVFEAERNSLKFEWEGPPALPFLRLRDQIDVNRSCYLSFCAATTSLKQSERSTRAQGWNDELSDTGDLANCSDRRFGS